MRDGQEFHDGTASSRIPFRIDLLPSSVPCPRCARGGSAICAAGTGDSLFQGSRGPLGRGERRFVGQPGREHGGGKRMTHTSPATVTTPPEQAFYDFMASKGLAPPDLPIADGERHRYHVDGDKPGTKNGWYVLHIDGVPAGSFGSWKDGPPWHKWCAKEHLSDAERKEYRQRMKRIKAARAKEQAERHAKARAKAQSIWNKAPPVNEHPYLTAKGVEAYGLRLHNGVLVVPLRDANSEIHSLQFISDDDK